MASVHLARRTGSRGDTGLVAVKVLHGHLLDPEHRELFRREAQLIAQLRHPNVATLIEFGEQAGEPYLVMEYVEGSTLGALQAHAARTGGWLKPEVSLTICIDALAGLHAAHTLKDGAGRPARIVHRDVAPQNILVGVGGHSKVVDFGIAHTADTQRSEALRGRLAYMSPEQMRGQETDERADVYALGIVVWELLTAKRLFKHRHSGASIERIEAIPSVRSLKPELAQCLDDCVMRALAEEKHHRYATCEAFADALEDALEAAQLEPTRRGVSELVLGAAGRELEQRRASARAAATAESGPRWTQPTSSPGESRSAGSGERNSVVPAAPSSAGPFLAAAYSETSHTPPPVSFELQQASVVMPMSALSEPPGPPLADGSQLIQGAAFLPQAAPQVVTPAAGSRAWQWVLLMGLAALVSTLLVLAWQRSNPPETTVISPQASEPPPTTQPKATQTSGPADQSKPAEGALSLDDIPVWQGSSGAPRSTPARSQGAEAPAPETDRAPPAADTPKKQPAPDLDLSNPYR